VYFFSSFTGARSTAPSRKRQSPLKPRMPGYQGSFLNILAQPSSSFSSSFHVLRLLSSCLCLRAAEVFGEHHVNLSDDSLAVGITSLKDVLLTSTPRRKLTKGTYMATKICSFCILQEIKFVSSQITRCELYQSYFILFIYLFIYFLR